MSYLGIVLTSVFAANALLSYGLETCPGFRHRSWDLRFALALALVDCLAAGLLWCIRVLALEPLGLERLDLLVFATLAVPLLKVLSRLMAGSGEGTGFFSRIGLNADDLVVSCLVFGAALIASRGGYSLPEALASGAASGVGYWLAAALLGALRERLELSDLPVGLKGTPAMLVSAGLMAMAFMGIDSVFVANLVR